MNFGRGKVVLLATVFALVLSASAFADSVVYNQPFDGTGNAYSSQNDTTGGNGLFAIVYDNFKLGSASTLSEIQFTGEYFNPPAQGNITAWTVSFYGDSGGQPGSLLGSTRVNGTGGETFLGTFAGFPTYTYDITGLNFAAAAGTTYWVSVVPDLGFPPQWGWSSGTGGDGVSYQDFFGSRTQLAADMAFTLIGGGGNTGVPEPGTLVMLGTGVLGLAGTLRRKLF